MKERGKLSAKGAKIVAALDGFRDALEGGEPIERRYTVRQLKLDLPGRRFGPADVRKVRAALGVSQPILAALLGVDVKTIRSWEQGLRSPSPMARRFLEEIQDDPAHWRGRLQQLATRESPHP